MGRARLHDVRDLAVADLLGRVPVGLDMDTVRHLVEGKRVLVTGAGGTIGSELSRQIAALGPKSLVLFERYENALWEVERSVAGLNARRAGAFRHRATSPTRSGSTRCSPIIARS